MQLTIARLADGINLSRLMLTVDLLGRIRRVNLHGANQRAHLHGERKMVGQKAQVEIRDLVVGREVEW